MCALMIGVVVYSIMLFKNTEEQKSKNYSDIVGYFRNQKVVEYSMNLGSGDMVISLKDGTKVNYTAPSLEWIRQDIKDYIKNYNEENPSEVIKENIIPSSKIGPIIYTIVSSIPFIVLVVLGYFFMKKMSLSMMDGTRSVGDFGKSKFKDMSQNEKPAKFKDVAGADEEKEELKEIVEFLKNPEKFNNLGARIPKGVLLVGPPGTGKTLLARAVAGEAGVPFFSISGSDFVEMFVGVGASRVRSLFEQAKKNAPCIIFIDEIDAVGRQRGAGLGGGHDEREQTLNQLLVEMDGFGANEGVIMIAATNRPDILDKALMRPGRFDRQVVVSYPDIKGRHDILKVHSAGKPLAPDVELETIAKSTAGFTGADLENLLNEAALLTARRDLKAITMEQIEEATIKVVVGTEKKSKVMSDNEKKITAYHEGGHAIVTYFCEKQDPVHQISIIPRGLAGGYTMSLPSEDRVYRTLSEMREDIMVLLGGRVAEDVILGDISTGASNDIERATHTAQSMVQKYGMSQKLGPVAYGSDDNEVFIGRDIGHTKNYSERVASEIDEEVKKIIVSCYEKTKQIIVEHAESLHKVADFLIKNEEMSGEEFNAIMQQ